MTPTAYRRIGSHASLIGAWALIMVVAFAGCAPEESLSDVACEDDEECPLGAECDSGYCVIFDEQDAQLTIDTAGLPGGLDANISIEGPEQFQHTLSQGQTFGELWGGSYTMTVEPVESVGARYVAEQPVVDIELAPGESKQATADYQVVYGSVQVDISGLPDGAVPDVDLVDTEAVVVDTIEGEGVFDEIEPGDYSVEAAPFSQQGTDYVAASREVVVESDATAMVQLDYIEDPGTMAVEVQGLPDGIDHQIELVDADEETTPVPQDGLVEPLAPGSYLVRVDDVQQGGALFEGDDIEDAVVQSNETTDVLVDYQVVPGVVDIDIEGLPDGLEPDIEFVDTDDEVAYQTTGGGAIDVDPGVYDVVPGDVDEGVATYVADSVGIEVESNQTTAVTLDYGAVPGQLQVDVTGLPDGVDHDLELVGDQNYDVPQDGMVADVAPGSYTLEATNVDDGLSSYEAGAQSVTIESDQTAQADVVYDLILADLEVVVAGLPPNIDGNVLVDGGDIDQTITGTQQFSDIEPGQYTITPFDVDDGSATYEADELTIDVASGDDLSISVDYEVITATLVVTINGLDDGLESNITVEDPGGSQTLIQTTESSQTLSDLEPGSYDILVGDVDDDPARYSGDDSSVELESGETVGVSANYDLVLGELFVEAAGLPEDVQLQADVTGTDYSEPITGEQTLTELEPGDYTVAYQDVEDGNATYKPDPAQVERTVYSEGFASTDSAHTDYEVVRGNLHISVDGLDIDGLDEADANITVEGPDGYTREITTSGTTELNDLEPDQYQILVGDAEQFPATFEAGDITDVDVISDQTTNIDINYQVVYGDLTVDAEGLPDDLELSATVDGPGGFSETFIGPASFFDELPGDYDVTFHDRNRDNAGIHENYSVDPQTIVDTVVSTQETTVTGDYELDDGTLSLSFDIPAEDGAGDPVEPTFEVFDDQNAVAHTFTVTDPDIDESVELEPGTYTVELESPVEDAWGNEFSFAGLQEAIDVDSNDISTHNISAPLPTEVTTEEDDIGTYGSIREVVDRVEDTSIITFANSVNTISLSGESITVDRPLSFSASDDVVIEAELGDHRLFDVDLLNTADISFSGLTLQNGSAPSGGAISIDIDGVNITFFDVDFVGNSATDNGGAVSLRSAPGDLVTFNGGVFDGNSADSLGGALYAGGDTNVDFESVEFTSNSAATGGGLHVEGDAQLVETAFIDNIADGPGGAVHIDADAGIVDVQRSLFSNNQSEGSGGAIHAGANIDIENSTFSGNEVSETSAFTSTRGGAILLETPVASRILHVTMIDNVAAQGSGIFNENSGDIELRSSYLDNLGDGDDIELADTATGINNPVNSAGYNFVRDDVDDALTNGPEDEINTDSDFEVLSDNGGATQTHAIVVGEIGYRDIDAANCLDFDGVSVDYDQRGTNFVRPVESESEQRCTRGAWEDQNP